MQLLVPTVVKTGQCLRGVISTSSTIVLQRPSVQCMSQMLIICFRLAMGGIRPQMVSWGRAFLVSRGRVFLLTRSRIMRRIWTATADHKVAQAIATDMHNLRLCKAATTAPKRVAPTRSITPPLWATTVPSPNSPKRLSTTRSPRIMLNYSPTLTVAAKTPN